MGKKANKVSDQASGLGTWRHVLLVALAALLAHAFCLGAPFYMDDQAHLNESTFILDGAEAAFEKSKFILFRSFTYAIWIALHSAVGFSSVAFHALNLILHISITVALYFTSRELVRFSSDPGIAPQAAGRVAFWGALIFAVHPLGTETTHYASQTSIQWVTLSSLLAVFFALRWIRSPHWQWILAIFAACLLATFSKEPGMYHAWGNVFLTVLLLGRLVEYAHKARNHPLLSIVTGVAIAAGTFVFMQRFSWIRLIRSHLITPTILLHFLTQARVFWEYAWRLCLPGQLCSDHFLPHTISTGDTVAWIALAGIVVVILINLALYLRGRRLDALVLALFLAPILIRFLWQRGEVMVEYRLYPALPWFALGVALVLFYATRRKPLMRPWICSALAALLLVLCINRSLVWQSPESIVENIQRQYPLHMRSHSYIQSFDFHAGRHHEVIERQKQVQRNLNAILDYNRNKAAHHRAYDAGHALAGFMLGEQLVGYALVDLGRAEEADARMTEVIKTMLTFFRNDNSRGFGVLYRARGKARTALGDIPGARQDYEACLERKPGDAETLKLLEELGE